MSAMGLKRVPGGKGGGSQAQGGPDLESMEMKRVTPAGSGDPSKRPRVDTVTPNHATYVCYTRGSDSDEVVVRTLTGEYVEKGVNHGRKVYQKLQDSTRPGFVDVWLYYWDSRDGPSFEGWWFGNTLGGTKVWSHCKDASSYPPEGGWQIPWDGAVRQTLTLLPKNVAEQRLHTEREAQRRATVEQEVRQISMEMSAIMSNANAALEQATAAENAHAALEVGVAPDGISRAEQMLTTHVSPVADMLRKLADAHRGRTEEAAKYIAQLGTQLQTVQTNINSKLAKLQELKQKSDDERAKIQEEKDLKVLEALLPECQEKTSAAEDLVEKTAITADVLNSCDDDIESATRALEDTETAAQTAQGAVAEARMCTNKLAATIRSFGEQARIKSNEELSKLQDRIKEAQHKLDPLKTMRRDRELRKEAQKVVVEVVKSLEEAESDIEKAEDLVNGLFMGDRTPEELSDAQQCLVKAQERLSSVVQPFETKKASASGVIREELSKLDGQCSAAQSRLTQLKASIKEAGERVTRLGITREANEKLQEVTDAIDKAGALQGTLLMGDDVAASEALAAAKEMEAALALAQSASSMAKIFIATKLVEVKRFSSTTGGEATTQLQGYQEQLEAATEQIRELKTKAVEQKRLAVIRDLESQVGQAEILVEKVKEDITVFGDESAVIAMSAPELQGVFDKATASEKAAAEALSDLRKQIIMRQVESRGKDSAADLKVELVKLQSRISAAESENAKCRRSFGPVEQKLATKNLAEDAGLKLKIAEEQVTIAHDKVQNFVARTSDPEDAPAAYRDSAGHEARLAFLAAQKAVKELQNYIEVNSRTSGVVAEAVARVEPGAKAVQERITEVDMKINDNVERFTVSSLLQELETKVKDAEELIPKAAEAEQPLLGEVPKEEVSAKLQAFETANQKVYNAVFAAKKVITENRVKCKKFANAAAVEVSSLALANFQDRVDEAQKTHQVLKNSFFEKKKLLAPLPPPPMTTGDIPPMPPSHGAGPYTLPSSGPFAEKGFSSSSGPFRPRFQGKGRPRGNMGFPNAPVGAGGLPGASTLRPMGAPPPPPPPPRPMQR